MVTILLSATCTRAQVSLMGTRNYFMNVLTDIYSAYDWHYEPFKTDRERDGLRGNVVKMVMVIKDKIGRGYGEDFVDTVYYNQQGNITGIGAPHIDPYFPQKKYRPYSWTYEYDTNGKLKGYTHVSEAQTANGGRLEKGGRTILRDARGNITKEINGINSRESIGSDNVAWTFDYDANGTLTSGIIGNNRFKLTYLNGQLTSILASDFNKPATFAYNAQGRMTTIKWFACEEFDDNVMCTEVVTALTYNEKGDLVKAVEDHWMDTEKWVRKSKESQTTYTVTYTYDTQGNWTKAVIARRIKYNSGVDNTPAALTITRTLTYGKSESAATGTGVSNQNGASGEVQEVVEKPAAFPGGASALMAYISNNIHYPAKAQENGIQGKVMVSFIVEKDGSLSDIKVVRSVNDLLDAEAIRVVKGMPKWTPGMQSGKPVRTRFTLPIPFRLI